MFVDGIQKKENIHSFLMIGQSNMAGRGNFGEVPPIQNDRCFMLRMGRWQAMSEPINPDRAIFRENCTCGVSLAASFADEYAKTTGFEVGLIPCADGGTIIEQWQPGEVLYDHAVMMTRLAMRTSRLAGILWHQGESNSRNLDEEKYRRMFLNTMNSLRRDLGAEELPLLIGEISGHIAPEWGAKDADKMNSLLDRMQYELPMCRLVEAKELPLKPDGIHFNSRSCRELGKRYFAAYKELTKR
jgi:hypothetical protein